MCLDSSINIMQFMFQIKESPGTQNVQIWSCQISELEHAALTANMFHVQTTVMHSCIDIF